MRISRSRYRSREDAGRRARTMKILLIEDEGKIGDYLKRGLTEAGFTTDWVQDGLTGQQMAMEEDYGLLILDVMLPERDGYTLLRHLREAGKETPVMFLTARDQLEDRVHGLELGADDYLVKPFAFSELLARVRSLLRRSPLREGETLQVADLELDLRRRRAIRGGKRIDLTAKEFALLELLMRREGEILPRALIASQVWDMNFDSDTNVVEVAIKRLRSKVDTDVEVRLIHTVRGMGYVLEAPSDASLAP
jgi:two-component system, OmpR family, copper resistance phosphate regulon response regulator CusR